MRKHFLLLALMVLLPLAGWAEDISSTSVTIGDVVYGETTNPKPFVVWQGGTLGVTEHYTVDSNYYSEAACETVVGNDISKLGVGEYWMKIEGVPAGGFTGTVSSSFKVVKAELHVTINGGTALHTVYGTPFTVTTPISYSAADNLELKNGDAFTDVVTGTITAVHYEGTNATKTATGKDFDTPADPYDVTFDGLTSANYKIICTGGMDIWQKDITDGEGLTFTLNAKSAAYNGAEQALNYTVKLGETTLEQGADKDYTVAVFSDAERTTYATAKNVAKYYTKIVGVGNFAGEHYVADNANFEYDIIQAGLTIRVLPQSKVYDGNPNLPSSAEGTAYEVLGKYGSDAIGTVTLSGNTSKDVKTYTITANVDDKGQNGNYDYNFVPANFVIEKRGLTITANDAQKVLNKGDNTAVPYGGGTHDAIGFAGVTLTPAPAFKGDTWAMSDVSGDITLMKSTATNGGKLQVVRTNNDELKDKYEGVLKVEYATDAAVWQNYDITTEDGDFYILGGKIYVTALNHSKNYGAADPDWSAPVLDEDYIVSGLSGTETLATAPTLSCTHDEAVGTYTINISGAVAPAGYEEIVYATAEFEIKTRPITIVAKAQTLKVGDKAEKIDQTAYTISNTDSNEGLKEGDLASEVFTLAFAEDVSLDAAEALEAHAPYAAGFKTVGGIKAGNYAITFTNAKLTVVAADALVLNDAEDLSTLAAATGKDVTFTAREIKKGVWTSLVLPFTASVREISNALGYAIVDKFVADENSTDMNFKIYMGEIEAYTPFLVKVDEDINMNTVTFKGVDIEALNEDNLNQSNKSFNFVGKMDLAPIASDFWAIGSLMTEDNFTFNKYAAGKKVAPMRAFITAKPGVQSAPVIFIEEADGSVSAINAINAEGEAVTNDGWYTLGGVKLQSVPTEKGLYIHNGKKIVIK